MRGNGTVGQIECISNRGGGLTAPHKEDQDGILGRISPWPTFRHLSRCDWLGGAVHGRGLMMKSNIKNDLKAEKECIDSCVTALLKLSNYYWKPTSGDSVAEKQANNAITRVWDYTARIFHE